MITNIILNYILSPLLVISDMALTVIGVPIKLFTKLNNIK